MDYNKFERNLIILLKIFNNRPNHLSKFLIDNDSFTDEFRNMILNSDKLNDLRDFDVSKMDFSDYKEMNEFFSDLINKKIENSDIDLEKSLNDKLFELISEERYEEAANLRDYMNKKNINIKL